MLRRPVESASGCGASLGIDPTTPAGHDRSVANGGFRGRLGPKIKRKLTAFGLLVASSPALAHGEDVLAAIGLQAFSFFACVIALGLSKNLRPHRTAAAVGILLGLATFFWPLGTIAYRANATFINAAAVLSCPLFMLGACALSRWWDGRLNASMTADQTPPESLFSFLLGLLVWILVWVLGLAFVAGAIGTVIKGSHPGALLAFPGALIGLIFFLVHATVLGRRRYMQTHSKSEHAADTVAH